MFLREWKCVERGATEDAETSMGEYRFKIVTLKWGCVLCVTTGTAGLYIPMPRAELSMRKQDSDADFCMRDQQQH